MIRKHLPAFGFGLMAAYILHPIPTTFAHNTIIEYQATEAIAIEAKFDDGKAITNAQVVVYAPDNPTQPWKKGLTDDEGKFAFIPDYNNQGNWTIKVRSAGHGSVITIPIQSLSSAQKNNNLDNQEKVSISPGEKLPYQLSSAQNTQQLSLPQKLMMATMGSWGFVGTALFFSRKNKKTLN